MINLEESLAKLILENQTLKSQVQALIKENYELKEKLGLNSKNSSIPSSKELYKIKNNSKRKSDNKQGGQVGHRGYFRDKIKADEVIKIDLPSTKCECGGDIGLLSKPHIHQKIDIPEIRPHVTEYHLQKGRCRTCGRRKKSELPANISGDLFGAGVKTIISALTGFYKNSKREVEAILKDIFNLEISLGTISNNEARVAKKCLESYEEIELELSYSEVLHIDETSHYNKGKMGWCWMFSSVGASMIKLVESRGMKVLANSVIGPSDSVIVTDRYAAYNYFDEEKRQVCWSHLARDFERLAHSFDPAIKPLGYYLKTVASELFALKKALVVGQVDILRFTRRARKLRKRTCYYLKEIANSPEAIQACRVAKNIIKSENMLWKFLDDPINIPLTNNHAELQISHYVVYRKNSYITQSDRGNRFLERIISLYLTWKQKNENPVRNLRNLLIA